MSQRSEDLTEREWEILRLLVEGLSNKEIASALCITVNTVETHLRHIYEKLGVRNRLLATAWYTKNLSE